APAWRSISAAMRRRSSIGRSPEPGAGVGEGSARAAARLDMRGNVARAARDEEAGQRPPHEAVNQALRVVMQLRTLQTLDGQGPSASNTVVLARPDPTRVEVGTVLATRSAGCL